MKNRNTFSRRRFLKTSALAALGGWAVPNIIPARVLGREGATPIAHWPSMWRSDLIPVLVDVAGRAQSEVRWDPVAKRVTAPASAQPFLRRAMRDPWGALVYKHLETRKA
jgi:hypothetical protein